MLPVQGTSCRSYEYIKIRIFTWALCILQYGQTSFNRPWDVSDCSQFAGSVKSALDDGSRILNETYYPVGGLNITNVSNSKPLCRIFGETDYANNNTILFQLWLPAPADYSSRFLVVGNGGMAGTIDEAALMKNTNEGYAVAGGDGGHRASENNGGSGNPGVYLPYMHDQAQVQAWVHNSIAQFTPVARFLTEQFYREPARHSYYVGCSTGGAQGFALAQYHPGLFDGIIAGCPGNWYSHLALSFLWNSQKTQGSSYLPQSALDLITKLALAQCDAIDGVEDGVIENPLLCDFDINSLACDASATDPMRCLTETQLAAAKDIYAGPVDSRTNASLYPGFSLGSETQWAMQEGELANAFTIPILQNMVFGNLAYDAGNFNWGSDVDLLNERVGTYVDEINPDLSAFQKAGGKMIVMQSWADPYNAALWPIQHLKQLEEASGGNVGDWFRLFMVPGGGHCGSASNYPQVPAEWHSLEAMTEWIESKALPEEMTSSNPADKSSKTRKLCPWPKTAKYTGGNTDEWTSYKCVSA
ncbi:tannase and feruloyl esterase [Apiospora saccharicola]|uniref:Carboxylic ester hydrolase n=1 Tax=Apiospora saccharicola TaxID=335842 RepID=A0ABR1VA03_9PEZI